MYANAIFSKAKYINKKVEEWGKGERVEKEGKDDEASFSSKQNKKS